MSSVGDNGTIQERQPFDVAWETIDGLKVRYATGGGSGERIVLFSPWPESILAFAPVWSGLVRQFQVLAIDLPGFGRSEGRDDLFTPQTMGDFIVKAIDAFGLTSIHAIGLDVGTPSLLFASLARPDLFRSLIVGAGAATHPLGVEGTLIPYGLARDPAVLREWLPKARLDVLEAGHCVWEERAPEVESIVTQRVSGGFRGE